MTITNKAIGRPVATTMIFLIVVTLGMIGFRFLPVDLLPPIEMPELTVSVNYPNVGPEEMELLVTEPLENALSIVANIERVNSNSREGSSSVTLRFSQNTNLDEATNEVRDALDRLRNSLPQDAQPPRIQKFDPDNAPIMVVGAQSSHDLMQLTTILERDIRRRFEQIQGIGAIDVFGGLEREIRIEVIRDRLLAAGLTTNDLVQAVGRESVNRPGGNVQRGLSDVYVRSLGEFRTVDEIGNTVVRTVNGVPIRVSDVAQVHFDTQDIWRYIEIDDIPMLRLGIRKQSGANTVAVAEEVHRIVERINRERSDLQLLVISDQSAFIRDSINSVRNSAIWGGILALVILLAFFRNGSIIAVIAVAIPISIVATFALLYLNALTLNQMSFGGLALGVGLIVDNSIVVIENIVRLRQGGKSLREAASVGTGQVGGAILASTLTTCVIFLPVVFMQTITGKMFQELAMVVVFALLCSLTVALTLVPMLASRFLTIRTDAEAGRDSSKGLLAAAERRYEKIVGWALGHKALVVLLTSAVMLSALYGARHLSFELAPQSQADTIRIRMNMDEGTNIAILHSYLMEMDAVVKTLIPERGVLHYTRDVRNSNAEIELTLDTTSGIDSNALADHIRAQVLNAIPGMRVRVDARSGMRVMRQIFGSGGEDAIQIELRGYDLTMAENISQTIRERVELLPGIVDVNLSRLEGRPEQSILFDREMLANLGISLNDISQAIQASVGGTRAGVFREAGEEIDITVRLRPEDRLNVQDIENISVRSASGEVVPVSSLITTSYGRGPTDIRRINNQRVTYIYANLEDGVALGNAMLQIQNELRQLALPDGFSLVYGGEFEEQQKAQRDFIMAIIMALALIYMVMAAQFERFLDPLIVMFSVPLAVIGVVPMLLLTGTTMNMQSFMGLVMLIGIVVNNAIVLVDYINLMRRQEKMAVCDAVVRAGRMRLRPILMTTMTTILALMPLALGIGPGSEMQAPLARVVIGGLAASTLITLVFIPVVYVTANALRDEAARRIFRRKPGAGDVVNRSLPEIH